jgi:T5SS/PEP-CTERM-associated repeat protein
MGVASNRLYLSTGARVYDATGYVGFAGSSSNNTVWVVGGNTVWSNRYQHFIGYSGSSNSLVILDGGVVFARDGYIGWTLDNRLTPALSKALNLLSSFPSGVRAEFDAIIGNEGATTTHTSILVVDDDPAILEVLRITLGTEGYAVHGVEDPLTALAGTMQ